MVSIILSHDYKHEYKPTFVFVEFINHIGGIISMWFGLSRDAKSPALRWTLQL
jgi:hypothetical protein